MLGKEVVRRNLTTGAPSQAKLQTVVRSLRWRSTAGKRLLMKLLLSTQKSSVNASKKNGVDKIKASRIN